MDRHRISMMNRRISESAVTEQMKNILSIPDLDRKVRCKYAEESGIDLQFIDLRTAVRGFMMQGRM